MERKFDYVKPPCNQATFNTNAFFADSEKAENGGSANYQDREDVWIINREYKPNQIKNKNELPKALLTKMIMYSSNPNDMVCDFFLGSFSTAKTAIGLGRNACGFEINKNAFDYQIQEIEKIKSGEFLSELRQVPENKLFNQGKNLTDEEINLILTDFNKLSQNGKCKKDAICSLSNKYGRGYFSISNIISNNNQHINKCNTILLFD